MDWKAAAKIYHRRLKAELAGSKKLHGLLVEAVRERRRLERQVAALLCKAVDSNTSEEKSIFGGMA